jgi:hypothetical protein
MAVSSYASWLDVAACRLINKASSITMRRLEELLNVTSERVGTCRIQLANLHLSLISLDRVRDHITRI